jgi:hypothetical protein
MHATAIAITASRIIAIRFRVIVAVSLCSNPGAGSEMEATQDGARHNPETALDFAAALADLQ